MENIRRENGNVVIYQSLFNFTRIAKISLIEVTSLAQEHRRSSIFNLKRFIDLILCKYILFTKHKIPRKDTFIQGHSRNSGRHNIERSAKTGA